MLNWIKNLFVGTPAPTPTIDAKVEAANAVPYKVETPVIVPVADASVVIVVPDAVVPAAIVEIKKVEGTAVWPFPTAQPVETVVEVKTPTKALRGPKAAVVKKAVPKTASKKPRGRKPKAGA
jgi:hypothetical protein